MTRTWQAKFTIFVLALAVALLVLNVNNALAGGKSGSKSSCDNKTQQVQSHLQNLGTDLLKFGKDVSQSNPMERQDSTGKTYTQVQIDKDVGKLGQDLQNLGKDLGLGGNSSSSATSSSGSSTGNPLVQYNPGVAGANSAVNGPGGSGQGLGGLNALPGKQ